MTDSIHRNPTGVNRYQDAYPEADLNAEQAYENLPNWDAGEGPADEISIDGRFSNSEDGYDGGGISSDQLRRQVISLQASLQDNPKLSSVEKSELIEQLNVISGKINHSMVFSPEEQNRILGEVSARLSGVELKVYGLGDSDIQGLAKTSREEEDSELSAKGLKEKSRDIQKKIESLVNMGAISLEVKHELDTRLDRFNSELNSDKPDLEIVGELLSSLEETVNGLKSNFMINGEMIEEVPGADGVSEKSDGPEILQKLVSTVGGKIKSEEVLEKIKKHYPELDKNNDGKLENKELQDAIDEKKWPPITGPDQKMLDFFYDLDSEFKTYFDNAPKDNWQSWKSAGNRLVSLLKALYPDKESTIKVGDWSADPRSWDNFWFDGRLYKFANNGENPPYGAANPKAPLNSLCLTQWTQSPDGQWWSNAW